MKTKFSIGIIILALIAFYLYAQKGDKSELPSVTALEVREMIKNSADIVLLDVRTPQEYDGPMGHIEGSILIPVQVLEQRIGELEKYREKKIIVYCRSGNRSRPGTQILLKNGYHAVNMLGGMKAWNKLPEEENKK